MASSGTYYSTSAPSSASSSTRTAISLSQQVLPDAQERLRISSWPSTANVDDEDDVPDDVVVTRDAVRQQVAANLGRDCPLHADVLPAGALRHGQRGRRRDAEILLTDAL